MRRSARLVEKQAKDAANEAQREPGAKKKRSNGRTTNIATLDNGTMVESLKYLNYCQLAKNSLVSKRFLDLIRTHRRSLALLYVDSVFAKDFTESYPAISIFDQQLSPEDYKKWVIRNRFSKRIPMEGQVVGKPSALYGRQIYVLWAYDGSKLVFYARTKLNHTYWPLFQHFVRLLSDPFIYIRKLEFLPVNDVLNLLAGAFNQDRNRLQCNKVKFDFGANFRKFIALMKNHVSCNEIRIHNVIHLCHCEDLLDLFVTGAQCTSAICINYCIPSRVVVEFVQKFKDLKSSDECQMVESIRDSDTRRWEGYMVTMKRDYGDFLVKEVRDEEDDDDIERVFEFVNDDVGKKLQITEKTSGTGDDTFSSIVMTIENL